MKNTEKQTRQQTPQGVLNIIYRNQLLKSKRTGIQVKYSYEEFKNRYLTDDEFLKLYINWIKSGCIKNKKPSFDRIDNSKGYDFNNLQLMTWEENNIKGRKECSLQVNQYDLDGNYIKTYNSIVEASKAVNVYKSNISACCKGKLKTSAGYIWKYSEWLNEKKEI